MNRLRRLVQCPIMASSCTYARARARALARLLARSLAHSLIRSFAFERQLRVSCTQVRECMCNFSPDNGVGAARVRIPRFSISRACLHACCVRTCVFFVSRRKTRVPGSLFAPVLWRLCGISFSFIPVATLSSLSSSSSSSSCFLRDSFRINESMRRRTS